ncbi:hypothetical protein CKO12_06300 [Chromatium okenii]|nr:hypothetical protein [Chromatium okenii]
MSRGEGRYYASLMQHDRKAQTGKFHLIFVRFTTIIQPEQRTQVMKNMVTILLLGVLMISGAVSADVDTGLVAYYCFDDASNLGKDCSTNGNNGTVEGSVTASTGFAGGAASFGGYYNSGAIHVPNSSSLQFTGDFSVAHAVKLSGLDGMDGWGNYKSPLNYDADPPFFLVFIKGEYALSTMLTTDIRNESIYYYSSFNPSPGLIEGYSINEWANIVYVYSNSEHTAKVFINGRLVSTHDVSINITNVNSEDIYIGRNQSYWHPMNGAIDEMRIYNRALTDAEVLQLAAPNDSADSGSINVSDVLSSHGITDILFNGSDVFVLATVKSPDGVYRVDPDGTRAYKSSLKIVRFNKDSNSYQSVVIGEVWPNGDPTSGHGALYLSGDYLYAFKNSKDDGNGYAQSGSIYKINVSDPAMISLESESKLFSASNWGWWPVFKSSSVLSHFSFAGYYRYENTSNLGSVLPSVMQQEYADAVAAHSQGLVLANEADTMGASSRPNVISRIQALMGEQQTTFSLAIKKSGTGSGSVTSKDGKINCGTICAADFDNGSSVILTATPDTKSGSTFSGWSGACTNKTGDCTVKMSEAQTVTANFNLLPSYKLSINKSGKGTVTSEPVGINCGTACSKTFTSGTAVTLTAKADTGATFTKWTGCTPIANKPLQCTVTLTSNKVVTAVFGANSIADIKIVSVAITPTSPAANSIFSAKITVKNQSTVTVNGGYLDVWANQPTAQTCGAFGEQWIEIGSLAAGATKTLTVNLRSSGAGAKTLRAFADSWCQTPESNEANNQLTKTYTVK